MPTHPQLDHAITNVLFHYHNINNRMPFGSIPERFTALYKALDTLAAEQEKATTADEAVATQHRHDLDQ